ncbi:DNA repair protein RAD50 [Cytospora mali]|uniref:DNA repair protein RAD50 n=1 Tax=Cytospora mali TaxID=578113 RepID=A0A194VG48_CYTMA|nr:DNA repair protein RAD50 [Valsa mali var. pyri (nom. inval.)]
MSRVEGMSIQGVRSFAPMTRESITLGTPLTLIVGYNGSGKTTLIECLKYATTGELPPNSKGGAFVYDPKLSNDKRVPAKVVLKFRSTNGTKYTVNRQLEVTLQKNGSRSMKTLETSLQVVSPSGEKSTTSTKVAAIDELVPQYLGVSPAILDAVIFCHQDESLWPMSEPSALKKKFDEIFAAKQYTKAMEQLKLVRKAKGDQFRQLQTEHKQNEVNKERGQKNQKLCEKLANDIEEYRIQVDAITEEMAEVEHKARGAREQANQFLSTMNDLQYNMDQYQFRQDAVAELRDSIEVMSEDDDVLQRALDQYETRLQRLKGDIEQHVLEYRSLQGDVTDTENKLNVKLGEKGKLQSDKEKFERQLETRIGMIQEAARSHEIRGFDGELDDNQVRAFHDKIQGIFNSKKKEHEQLQNRNAREADAANKGISELENEKNSRTSERAFARQKKTENDRKVKRLQTEVDSVNCDEVRIGRLENDKAALDERSQQAQDEAVRNDWDEKIRQTQEELRRFEQQGEDLNSELVNCTRLASERAQLDVRKQEALNREKALDKLTARWSKTLSEQVRPDWQIESLESDFKAKMDERTSAVNKVKDECGELQQKLKQVEFKLAEANKQHQKLTDNKSDCEKSVMGVLVKVAEDPAAVTIDAYDDQLEDLEEAKLDVDKELKLFDELKLYWTQAETCLNTKNKCLMCDRAFDGDRSKSKILTKISKHLSDQSKADLQQEFRDVDKKVELLRAVRPKHDAFVRLKKELPATEKAIEDAKKEKESILEKLEAADDRRRKAGEPLEGLQSIASVISEIIQLSKGIAEAKEEVEKLTKSQKQSGGPVRSASEVREAMSTCAGETRKMRLKLDTLMGDRQRNRDLISNLELELSNLNGKITEAKQLMDRKRTLKDEIKALKEDNEAQDAAVSNIDAKLTQLQPRIDAARAQRDDALASGRKKADKVAEERDSVARTLSQLKIIEDDIQDYVDRGGEGNLASIDRSIQTLQQSLNRLKGEMEDLTRRINTQKEELSQGDRNKKNIRDNLKFRENCRVLTSIEEKIEKLRSEDAEKDYDRLMNEAKRYDREHSLLQSRKSEVLGQSSATDKELARAIELYEQEYKGAEEMYRKSSIQLATTKGAIQDLATFGNSLDKAIMHYHSLKMEEVNRIAGELWRATYQGTDIDTIAIRSDADSNNSRRTYNYRVTMVKQDTEMDMRGRCSAGQKVLASIIIRLALAESFGISCGLIALDEPTTNLDSDNIRSLAVSLHGIIKARQSQTNFQLIVITHDEEFLRHMRCSDFCDKFYRVKRDENQCSKVEREEIGRITE